MTGQDLGDLGVVYDLVSEAYCEVNSPMMYVNIIQYRELVSKELESAMKILQSIAARQNKTPKSPCLEHGEPNG